MAITSRVKHGVNSLLRCWNLRLDSLTAENHERSRLRRLADHGYFERAVFPVPPGFARMDPEPWFAAVRDHSSRLADLEDPSRNQVGYSFDNHFFSSPDAEVLYSLVRQLRPARIVEVGSGHSTKVIRQAIRDGALTTRLVCVDPCPRTPIHDLADQVFAQPVESLVEHQIFAGLNRRDMLFIDSSHALRPGNDVVALYLRVLPGIAPGVVVHIHDVFLPYDYPTEWVLKHRWIWDEQYLVHAMLTFGDAFEVLWAGHYLQRTHPQFSTRLPRAGTNPATSLWLRKK